MSPGRGAGDAPARVGALYRKIGRGEQSRGELAPAVEIYRAMEMPFWLQRAEAELSRMAPIPQRLYRAVLTAARPDGMMPPREGPPRERRGRGVSRRTLVAGVGVAGLGLVAHRRWQGGARTSRPRWRSIAGNPRAQAWIICTPPRGSRLVFLLDYCVECVWILSSSLLILVVRAEGGHRPRC
jgi:hypothetical protein